MTSEEKFAVTIVGIVMLLTLIFWGGVAYIVLHFVQKFW